MPCGSVGLVLALLVLVLLVRQSPRSASSAEAYAAAPLVVMLRAASPAEKTRMTGAAWFATGIGLLAVTYALTGSQWFTTEADSTETMRRGMALGLLALLPLVLTVGRFLESRRGAPGTVAAPPTIAVTAALVVASAASGLPLGDIAQWNLLVASVGIGAYAGGRTAFAARIVSPGTRLPLACAVGGGYAVFPGLMVSTAGAFAAPLLGVMTLLWLRRSAVSKRVLVRA